MAHPIFLRPLHLSGKFCFLQVLRYPNLIELFLYDQFFQDWASVQIISITNQFRITYHIYSHSLCLSREDIMFDDLLSFVWTGKPSTLSLSNRELFGRAVLRFPTKNNWVNRIARANLSLTLQMELANITEVILNPWVNTSGFFYQEFKRSFSNRGKYYFFSEMRHKALKGFSDCRETPPMCRACSNMNVFLKQIIFVSVPSRNSSLECDVEKKLLNSLFKTNPHSLTYLWRESCFLWYTYLLSADLTAGCPPCGCFVVWQLCAWSQWQAASWHRSMPIPARRPTGYPRGSASIALPRDLRQT